MRRQKPLQVTRATQLLWASLAVGVVVSLLDAAWFGASAPFGFVLLMLVVVLAMSAVLIYEISQGKNWARLALLLLFAFGLATLLPGLNAVFARSAGMGALSVLQCLVQVAALYLVFSDPGAAWFRRKSV